MSELFKFGCPRLTLKEGPKVKSDHIRRFQADNFLLVGFTLQTSRTNNKRVISAFKFGYPHLTLKEGPKVKSDHINRFPAHDFLLVGFTLQTSRTTIKQVISTFKFGCPHLTLKEGSRVKSDHIRRFPLVCYMGYFGILWMTLNEKPQGQMSARLQRTSIYVIHITYEEIQPSTYDNQPVEEGR